MPSTMWLSKRRSPTPCQIQVPEGGQGPHGLGYTRGEGSPPSSGGGTPHMNREHLSSQSPAYSWVLILMLVLLLEPMWCSMPSTQVVKMPPQPQRVVQHAPTQFASMPSSQWPGMPPRGGQHALQQMAQHAPQRWSVCPPARSGLACPHRGGQLALQKLAQHALQQVAQHALH